jgi:hypothetical protein
MRINPTASGIASVFIAVIGVAALYMYLAGRLNGSDAHGPAVIGGDSVVVGVVGFWCHCRCETDPPVTIENGPPSQS